MTMLHFPDLMYLDGQIQSNLGIAVDDTGRIVGLGSRAQLTTLYLDARIQTYHGRILIPGTANAHNHSFQVLMRGMGEDDTFMNWRSRVLYPVSNRLTRQDIHLSAKLAYWDMLRHGITTVADFFYLNDQGIENALAIAQAAQEVGIRLCLARTFYDWEGAPPRYRETAQEAHDNTLELALLFKDNPMVRVQVAPHSPHGASQAMIEAAVATARELDTRLHIHVAEGEYERDAVMAAHHLTPIEYLYRLGALTDMSLAIHAVWIDEHDLELIKDSGATVVHNPSSNMILGDGIAPVVKMLQREIPVALGTDGGCTNDRHSILDDMRQAALLQKVFYRDGHILDAATVFSMGTEVGSKSLGVPSGSFAMGQWFDAVTLDLEDPSLLPGPPTIGHLVYALSPTAIDAVFVSGRQLIAGGKPLSFDPKPLIDWARAQP